MPNHRPIGFTKLSVAMHKLPKFLKEESPFLYVHVHLVEPYSLQSHEYLEADPSLKVLTDVPMVLKEKKDHNLQNWRSRAH